VKYNTKNEPKGESNLCHDHGFQVTLKLILTTYTAVPNTACDSGKELSISVVLLDEGGKIRAIYLSGNA
jgi:hypothetical protein